MLSKVMSEIVPHCCSFRVLSFGILSFAVLYFKFFLLDAQPIMVYGTNTHCVTHRLVRVLIVLLCMIFVNGLFALGGGIASVNSG